MKGTTAAQKALNPREAKNLCELSQAESRHYSIHFSKKERRLYGEKSYEVKPAQLSRGKGRLEPRRKKIAEKIDNTGDSVQDGDTHHQHHP